MTQFQVRVDDAGRHQVYATEWGVDRRDVGEPFKTPRQAIEYSDLLAARASRSAAHLTQLPGLGPVAGEPGERPSEAPGPQEASWVPEGPAPASTCVVCGGPLPPGSRRQRRTCSGACRIARYRRDNPAAQAKDRARKLVALAIERGEIVRTPCVGCGNTDSEAHHPHGYEGDAALDVVFLCKVHHHALHDHSHPGNGPESVSPAVLASTATPTAPAAGRPGAVRLPARPTVSPPHSPSLSDPVEGPLASAGVAPFAVPASLEGPDVGARSAGSSKDAGPVSSRSHGSPVQNLGL